MLLNKACTQTRLHLFPYTLQYSDCNAIQNKRTFYTNFLPASGRLGVRIKISTVLKPMTLKKDSDSSTAKRSQIVVICRGSSDMTIMYVWHAKEPLTGQWPSVQIISQNYQPFSGSGDISLWVKILERDEKSQTCLNTRIMYLQQLLGKSVNSNLIWWLIVSTYSNLY